MRVKLDNLVVTSGRGENMLTVEGVYNNGQIELLTAVQAENQSKVLITFLETTDIDLRALGIDEAEAADLRGKFATFEDWNDPEMDIYNDYDNARTLS